MRTNDQSLYREWEAWASLMTGGAVTEREREFELLLETYMPPRYSAEIAKAIFRDLIREAERRGREEAKDA